jgi:hypothetical protein
MVTAELTISLEEMGVLEELRRKVHRMEAKYALHERLEGYLRDRLARGFAQPQGVVDLLDELERV